MDVRPLFIPHAKTTELVQPSEGAFDDPAPSSQPAAMFRIAHSEQRQDVASTQSLTDFLCVVGPITQYAIRAATWSATKSLKRWNGVEQWLSLC